MPTASVKLPRDRLLFHVLGAAAVIYAFLAGLKTIAEFDLGWQMATGRWIAQHHQIPSTDVLSYTAAGQPWIYPVGSGLLFYGLFLLGGYALLSWLTAFGCAGTIALVLRRGSAMTAALAILAVPPIASRITARAEMFTVVLFAATLSLLWQQHKTGDARLWLLPVLMAAWVNLHPGFIAGLGLFGAYLMLEAFDRAWNRLRRALPWLLAACAATLINPWGWDIYKVVARQQAAMEVHSEMILEWAPLPLNWAHIKVELSPLAPDTFYLLLFIAASALVLALVRRRIGEALLLAAAAYFPVRHQRLTGLASIVMVVVGGAVFSALLPAVKRRTLAVAATALLICLTVVRAANLVSGRTYRSAGEIVSFGTGLSWWFPQKAADFVAREHLPARIFSGYSEGAYMAFRLGPEYQDFIDGRAIPFGKDLMLLAARLKSSPPDSPEWRDAAERYGIQTIVAPIGRYVALQFFPVLRQFCASDTWAPVYLDEVSAVFVRGAPASAKVDCATVPLPRGTGFNEWANAATVLHALGRNPEALTAAGKALQIHPDYGYLYFLRGHIYEDMGDARDAGQDFVRATELEPDLVAPWSALGAYDQTHGQVTEAIDAWEHAVAVSRWPWEPLQNLGYAYLQARRPQDALDAFNEAASSLPPHPELLVNDAFLANTAHGRARSWYRLGDVGRAISYEEEATRLLPGNAALWRQLAELYFAAGRTVDANRALGRAHP
ncbi:MAG: tetratricopeptide repeat protein [Bryobacteraceae bacterium]|jgi:tetratricopeptide (TPR) repeat protein